MCECEKGIKHWVKYTHIRLYLRWLLTVISGYPYQSTGMSRDEWEHWFYDKPEPRVLREALKVVREYKEVR